MYGGWWVEGVYYPPYKLPIYLLLLPIPVKKRDELINIATFPFDKVAEDVELSVDLFNGCRLVGVKIVRC